jgi:hypothetical protein
MGSNKHEIKCKMKRIKGGINQELDKLKWNKIKRDELN